jgi:hypothetical protein
LFARGEWWRRWLSVARGRCHRPRTKGGARHPSGWVIH